jgi:hypothetical protein
VVRNLVQLTETTNAQLAIKRFYYTNKLSFSLLDPNIEYEGSLEFYFIHGDTTIERLEVPVTPLYHVDELWVDLVHEIPDAKLFTRKVLESYSYRLIHPFH